MAIASYQLPVERYVAGHVDMRGYQPALPADSVEISTEARRLAAEAAENVHLWGEVRYDPPHTDDPDFPWEVAHQQWIDLMQKVFKLSDEAAA